LQQQVQLGHAALTFVSVVSIMIQRQAAGSVSVVVTPSVITVITMMSVVRWKGKVGIDVTRRRRSCGRTKRRRRRLTSRAAVFERDERTKGGQPITAVDVMNVMIQLIQAIIGRCIAGESVGAGGVVIRRKVVRGSIVSPFIALRVGLKLEQGFQALFDFTTLGLDEGQRQAIVAAVHVRGGRRRSATSGATAILVEEGTTCRGRGGEVTEAVRAHCVKLNDSNYLL